MGRVFLSHLRPQSTLKHTIVKNAIFLVSFIHMPTIAVYYTFFKLLKNKTAVKMQLRCQILWHDKATMPTFKSPK